MPDKEKQPEGVLCTIPMYCRICRTEFKPGQILVTDNLRNPTWIQCPNCKTRQTLEKETISQDKSYKEQTPDACIYGLPIFGRFPLGIGIDHVAFLIGQLQVDLGQNFRQHKCQLLSGSFPVGSNVLQVVLEIDLGELGKVFQRAQPQSGIQYLSSLRHLHDSDE